MHISIVRSILISEKMKFEEKVCLWIWNNVVLRGGLYFPKVSSPIGKIWLPWWKREQNSPSKYMVKYWGSWSVISPFLQNTRGSTKGKPALYCLQLTTVGHMLRDSAPGLRSPEDSPPFQEPAGLQTHIQVKPDFNSISWASLLCPQSSWVLCVEDPTSCSSLPCTTHSRCGWHFARRS